MKAIGTAMGVFWMACLGAITLFVFFLAVDAISPTDSVWLTATMAALTVLSAIHFWRVRHALGGHEHDELARSVHAMRERRGF